MTRTEAGGTHGESIQGRSHLEWLSPVPFHTKPWLKQAQVKQVSWLLAGFCLSILHCRGMVSDSPWFKIKTKPSGIESSHCRSALRTDSKNNPINISCFWFRRKSNSVNITQKCQNKQISVHWEDRTVREKAKCLSFSLRSGSCDRTTTCLWIMYWLSSSSGFGPVY